MITGGDSCLGLKISFNSLQNIDFTSCCTEGTRAEDPILTSVQFIVQQLGSQMEDKIIQMYVAWKTAWIRKKKVWKDRWLNNPLRDVRSIRELLDQAGIQMLTLCVLTWEVERSSSRPGKHCLR